jgi:hypothetical protein
MLVTLSMPLISMEQEQSPVTPTKKAKIEVALSLYKQTKEEMDRNQKFDEADKKACENLGISWEENNNTYFISKAVVKNSHAGLQYNYLRNQLLSAILATSESITEPKFSVNFPQTLPATFVEKLKQEKSITLTNDLYDEPFEIVVTLTEPTSFKANLLTSITITAILAGLMYFTQNR